MRNFKSSVLGLLLALGVTGTGLLASGGSAQAAIMTVTDLNAFYTAVGSAPVTTDTFSNDIASGIEITFDSGVVSTLAGGRLNAEYNGVSPRDFEFLGALSDDGADAPLTLIWSFPVPVTGFIADFSFIGTLDVTIPGSGAVFDIRTEMGEAFGRFGVIDSRTPFTQIRFSIQGGGGKDFFLIDNLRFAAAPEGGAVPEPRTPRGLSPDLTDPAGS